MRKTHSDKIREAVTDLVKGTSTEIIEWIENHYPEDKVNRSSYRADIIGCSVNHSSSHHYPSLRARAFLWFLEYTKQYRLARPDELLLESKIRRGGVPKSGDESVYINGIPVAKLSVTGQVLIPSKIREKMGFQTGDTLAFIINEKGILEVRKARIRLDIT